MNSARAFWAVAAALAMAMGPSHATTLGADSFEGLCIECTTQVTVEIDVDGYQALSIFSSVEEVPATSSKLTTRANSVSIIGAVPQDPKQLPLLAIPVPQMLDAGSTASIVDAQVALTYQSTAAALVFLSPLFVTLDPAGAQRHIYAIGQSSEVANLAVWLADHPTVAALESAEFHVALAAAIDDVGLSLGDTLNLINNAESSRDVEGPATHAGPNHIWDHLSQQTRTAALETDGSMSTYSVVVDRGSSLDRFGMAGSLSSTLDEPYFSAGTYGDASNITTLTTTASGSIVAQFHLPDKKYAEFVPSLSLIVQLAMEQAFPGELDPKFNLSLGAPDWKIGYLRSFSGGGSATANPHTSTLLAQNPDFRILHRHARALNLAHASVEFLQIFVPITNRGIVQTCTQSAISSMLDDSAASALADIGYSQNQLLEFAYQSLLFVARSIQGCIGSNSSSLGTAIVYLGASAGSVARLSSILGWLELASAASHFALRVYGFLTQSSVDTIYIGRFSPCASAPSPGLDSSAVGAAYDAILAAESSFNSSAYFERAQRVAAQFQTGFAAPPRVRNGSEHCVNNYCADTSYCDGGVVNVTNSGSTFLPVSPALNRACYEHDRCYRLSCADAGTCSWSGRGRQRNCDATFLQTATSASDCDLLVVAQARALQRAHAARPELCGTGAPCSEVPGSTCRLTGGAGVCSSSTASVWAMPCIVNRMWWTSTGFVFCTLNGGYICGDSSVFDVELYPNVGFDGVFYPSCGYFGTIFRMPGAQLTTPMNCASFPQCSDIEPVGGLVR